jgi:hypothetical protein
VKNNATVELQEGGSLALGGDDIFSQNSQLNASGG